MIKFTLQDGLEMLPGVEIKLGFKKESKRVVMTLVLFKRKKINGATRTTILEKEFLGGLPEELENELKKAMRNSILRWQKCRMETASEVINERLMDIHELKIENNGRIHVTAISGKVKRKVTIVPGQAEDFFRW